jgi:hypothetical protein
LPTAATASAEKVVETADCIAKASAVVMMRQWMEVSNFLMHYITTSPEKPLGNVERIWYRYEFQDSMGNLPHIHALIWITGGQLLERRNEILERIRGSSMSLIDHSEIDELIELGVLDSLDDAMQVKDLY